MQTTHETSHTKKIRAELRSAGISSLGLLRSTARFLPHIIHEGEHIEAAVAGRHKESEGLFGYTEGMLVATNRRVLYLDHAPGYTTMDEITYEVVSGVQTSRSGIYSSLTLFTKVANYTMSFAKSSCVTRFADYIEARRLDSPSTLPTAAASPQATPPGKDIAAFLHKHDTAVLSTIDRTGNPSGAVIYYLTEGAFIYLITKEGTRKSRNILGNRQVALTIYDASTLQTAQLQGYAEVETDPVTKEDVYRRIVSPHLAKKHLLPPVTAIQEGSFIVFRVTPDTFSFSDFGQRSA